jgi:small-conductance mechanosensitive channel
MSELNRTVISLAIASGAVVIALASHAALKFLILHRHSQKPFAIRGIVLQLNCLSGPVQSAMPAVFLLIVLPFLRFPAEVLSLIDHLAQVWFLCSLAYLAVCLIGMGRGMIMSRYQIDARDNLAARRIYTQIRVLERVLISVVLLIALATILMTFQRVRELGVSILASAGVAGLVVGFAAQRSLGALLAGIQIAIAQPIRIDDVVIVEGEWGKIEEINLTYAVIKIWDERRLVVPITYFLDKPFQNWTRTSSSLLGTVFIYADYSISVEDLRAELRRILESSTLWDRRVCVLQVSNASERTMELRALMSSPDSSSAWDLRCLVREKLIDFIRLNSPAALPRIRVEMSSDGTMPKQDEDEKANLAARWS